MGSRELRVFRFLPTSRANGPGLRAVVWVQGCTLACPGCFNPETHAVAGGQIWPVTDLFQCITDQGNQIEGLTLSGGEPLQQMDAVTALLRRVRKETHLSTLLFTGYDRRQLDDLPGAPAMLECLDVLIAGPYIASRRIARDLRGSENQTVHLLSNRYTLEDLQSVAQAELIISPDGSILKSGIDPPSICG
jgi:anaerobic ribonucleoside-triphosphate reductase activating protein